jgi:hypothetical protein
VLDAQNTLLSADFPGVAAARLEEEFGGAALFVAGAMGGGVVPDTDQRSFEVVRRLGETVAELVIESLRDAAPGEDAIALSLSQAALYLKNENGLFQVSTFTGALERELWDGDFLLTEVNLWRIGGLTIATLPGEATPDLGLRLRAALSLLGEQQVLVACMANDELGYLLPAHDFDSPIYDYERTLSIGRMAGDRCVERLIDLALLCAEADAP